MASSRVQIAELAGVSRQAVHKALRRGWLIAEADGRIDPKREPNASYLAHHAGAYDIRVRPMSTHRGPGQQRQAEAPFDVDQLSLPKTTSGNIGDVSRRGSG
jgi:hypothetical protein